MTANSLTQSLPPFSQNGDKIAVTVGNPVIFDACKAASRALASLSVFARGRGSREA